MLTREVKRCKPLGFGGASSSCSGLDDLPPVVSMVEPSLSASVGGVCSAVADPSSDSAASNESLSWSCGSVLLSSIFIFSYQQIIPYNKTKRKRFMTKTLYRINQPFQSPARGRYRRRLLAATM